MSLQSKPKREVDADAEPDIDGDDLPDGWTAATLGQLTRDISYGYTAKATENDVGPKLLRITDIQDNAVDWSTVPFCLIDDHRIDSYRLSPGDLVFARTGATTGKSFLIRTCPDSVFASYLIRVRPSSALLPEYVAAFFQTRDYWNQITDNLSGSAQPNCNASKLASLTVPIAPLAEQRRIVAKLELLLGKVSSSQQRLSRVPGLLKRFRQSVLAAACSGKLTADWREENQSVPVSDGFNAEYPDSWRTSAFGLLLKSIRSGTTAVPQLDPTEYEVLRSSSVRPGLIDYTDVRYLTEDQSQNMSNFLKDGDLLFTRLSGSLEFVANCVQVRDLGERRIQYPDRLFCARLNDPRQGRFFEIIFAAPQIRSIVTEGAKSSAGHQRISLDNIRNQVVPLPPLAEQQEIVCRVETLFAFADQCEARLMQAQAHVNRLTQSLLAKAFRGELVPTEHALATAEGRSYESASELLARIRASKPNTEPAKRKRGKASKT